MSPMVSIIVPVYNAQATLHRCVDSILGQEYKDIELILMDDGSSDDSGAICDSYAAADPRVIVVHQKNAGVSVTRNRALDLAAGTYLQFVDSDDWITPDATKLMVRAALEHDCDLVITDFYRVIGNRLSHKGDIDEDGVMNREQFAEYMMKNPADFYYGVLWNKLFRNQIVKEHQLRMDDRISWCEDFMFNLEYIRYAQVFYALLTPTYYYVRTKGSLVSQGTSLTKTIKMKRMVFRYYNDLYKNILDEETYEKNRFQVYLFLIDAAKDGAVPPVLISSSKKLGNELVSVCTTAMELDAMPMVLYRYRKLLDYYLRPSAIKYNLNSSDIWLLYCLTRSDSCYTKKEMADISSLSSSSITSSLQKLSAKGIIEVTEEVDEKPKESRIEKLLEEREQKKLERQERIEKTGLSGISALAAMTPLADKDGLLKEPSGTENDPDGVEKAGKVKSADAAAEARHRERQLKITLMPEHLRLLEEFAQAEMDFQETIFHGFDEDEIELFENMSARIDENIRKILL